MAYCKACAGLTDWQTTLGTEADTPNCPILISDLSASMARQPTLAACDDLCLLDGSGSRGQYEILSLSEGAGYELPQFSSELRTHL